MNTTPSPTNQSGESQPTDRRQSDDTGPVGIAGDPTVAGILADELGMSTIEYAMGSIAAAALAAVLYTVITGSDVVDAIRGIIVDALTSGPSA
ncbi:DUF4244 domain-containing protein [Corynebacterium sp. CCM 8864]|uniref:DUF4244 domain-containing protein n=1 Tax=Corynebacterium marambiense TaxID=2765364 RepID=A0ABS0VSA1_9CORY|nr:DUF4244 domain-containing protein [Corynebacterium marambiense]